MVQGNTGSMRVYVCVCMYECMYVRMHAYVYVCMCTCIFVYLYVGVYTSQKSARY